MKVMMMMMMMMMMMVMVMTESMGPYGVLELPGVSWGLLGLPEGRLI